MIDLLIDRVGNINVFNILNSGQYYSEANIQSAIDTDLIAEYIKEIVNLSRLSNQFNTIEKKSIEIKPELLKELKNISETFFEQFFPESIATKLRNTSEKYLHFSIDSSLSDIPWELLYNGDCFLSDKFYIGRTVKGTKQNNSEIKNQILKMLIIADPTEDLEWAQKEGETLFRSLKEKIPPSKLHIEFIAGKQITKLKLLSLIRDKHIIHYSGHLFFSEDPQENGWLLSDDKILKAREIRNSAFTNILVFSNSCNSSKAPNKVKKSQDNINDFASSFLLSGIKNFIGTKWEVADNERTLDFTTRFYLCLFNEKSIGESLHSAREFARKNYSELDLTWANYSLYGNPTDRIVSKLNHAKPKVIDPSFIKKAYPFPIAITYSKFMDLSLDTEINIRMNALIQCFQTFSYFIAFIVFNEHHERSFHYQETESEMTLTKLWDRIFQNITDFKKLQLSMFIESMINTFFSNREFIYKIIGWIDSYKNNLLLKESLEGYLITTEYYYENLLVELSELESFHFIFLPKNKQKIILLNGISPIEINLNTNHRQFTEEELSQEFLLLNVNKNTVLKLRNKFVNTELFLNSTEEIFLNQNVLISE